ncbi:MAG: ChaN family lipoprotein [Hydrogenothermaceae bacterium]|nr:ChaN family lipoprotein [Hydrogenothermaceae bacterium]
MELFLSPFFPLIVFLAFLPSVDSPDVVIVGENHTDTQDHRKQLEVIRDIYLKDRRVIIAMEMFQQPFQEHLDRYIENKIGEDELLEETEYKKRWGYDFSLYRDILNFARESRIKVVAINVPSELLKEVKEKGLDKISSDYLPKERLTYNKKELDFIYSSMEGHSIKDSKKFLEVQYSWDAGMAYKIVKLKKEFPDYKIVVLIGKGHSETVSRFIRVLSKDIKVVVY